MKAALEMFYNTLEAGEFKYLNILEGLVFTTGMANLVSLLVCLDYLPNNGTLQSSL